MKTKDEIRDFETEVDDFAASFVGARGAVPERGTVHVVNLAEKTVRKRKTTFFFFEFRTIISYNHTKIILLTTVRTTNGRTRQEDGGCEDRGGQ